MEEIDERDLRDNIAEIIKNGDLAVLTSKKIRKLLEKKYDTNLLHRKKEIDDIVMQLVDEQSDEEEDEKTVSSDSANKNTSANNQSIKQESPEETKPSGQSKGKKKRTENDSNIEEEQSESEDSASDYEAPKPKRRAVQKRTAAKSKEKTPKKSKSDESERGGKKKTGFSMPMVLSAELAELMGETQMARPEVVKKMWQIIRERDLFDPSDRRYTLCDDQLEKIIGKKRFVTFAMMKFLKRHLKDPALM